MRRASARNREAAAFSLSEGCEKPAYGGKPRALCEGDGTAEMRLRPRFPHGTQKRAAKNRGAPCAPRYIFCPQALSPSPRISRPRKRGNLSPTRLCFLHHTSPGPANAGIFRPQGSISFATHLPAPRTRESFAFKALSPSLRIPRPRKRGKLSPSKALPPSLRIPGPANAGIFRLQRLCLHRCASPAPRTWELFTCSCSIRLKTGL